MNELQQVDLEIVKEVVEICDEHNLTYYMIGGTFLGAIRHKGFIPWDDDVDLGMPRDDYEKFLEVASSNLSNHLQVVNYKTDSTYMYYITRIRDVRTKVVETRIGNDVKYTHASIDIFPLDGSPNNTVLRNLYFFRVMFHRAMTSLCYKDSIDPDRKRGLLERVFLWGLTLLPVERLFDARKQKDKIDALMRRHKYYDSEYVGCLMGAYRTNEMLRRDIFGKGEIYNFEDVRLRGPEKYDKFLTCLYGDYMKLPPVEARKTHFKIIDMNCDGNG